MEPGRGHGVPASVVRDALLEQLSDIIQALRRQRLSDDAVHRARKGITRCRAILRLLRRTLGDSTYRRENIMIRDAAGPLTAVRDAKVLVQTIRRLTPNDLARSDRSDPAAGFQFQLARLLASDFDNCRRGLSRDGLQQVAATLIDVRRRLQTAAGDEPHETVARKDMAHVYRKGRTMFANAKANQTDANLHEWRKQVRYLLHQIEIARTFGVRHLAKRRRRAEDLAETLGADRDLAILKSRIAGYVVEAKLPRPAVSWERRLDRRRSKLQRKATRLGVRLYAGKRHATRKWTMS